MVDAVVMDRLGAVILSIYVENNVGIFGEPLMETLIFELIDHLNSFFNRQELHWVAYLDICENSLPSRYAWMSFEELENGCQLITLLLL